MTNTPAQAIAKAKTISTGYKGLCLAFVRTCYGIPARSASAAGAWNAARTRHKTTSTAGIPAGAPVFFTIPGNPYGHVALYLGNGLFRSNYSAKSTVITASLNHAVFRGMKMLGWTEDLNGVAIKGLTSKPAAGGSSGAVVFKRGSTGSAVKAWQLSMNKVFPAYANFAGDGAYGDYSVQVTKEFQRRAGLARAGVVDAATAKAMRKNGVTV